MQPLPIDSRLGEVVQALENEHSLVVQAPPGTGKSTRIPIALQRTLFASATVLVAEPRRIAARLLATRVASEIGERTGQLVGYRVRFEQACSADTRVCYATSGVLLRQCVADPGFSGVACLVIDEFHERHLDTDLLLALALRAQRTTRHDLKLVVMSATLDTERVRSLLGGCRVVQTAQPSHPVDIEFSSAEDDRPLGKQVSSALRRLGEVGPAGAPLVFLPGAREIREVSAHLESAPHCADADILTLHGEMPLARQTDVLKPRDRRRVILATNVAESSITVPGVVNVVDSGLARRAACSPWTGLTTLETHKISRASAAQRSGRAGRLSRGRAIRLYSERDPRILPEYEVPEILRLDLCEAILLLRAATRCRFDELDCVDRPSTPQVNAAEQLLVRLGAFDQQGNLSPIGKRMSALALHPRLARAVIEADLLGIPGLGCLAAALLSEKDVRLDYRVGPGGTRGRTKPTLGDSDVLELIEAFETAAELNFDPSRCAHERLDALAARRVADIQRQLMKSLAPCSREVELHVDTEQALGRSLLCGFPDRVAWCRELGQSELVLTNGGTARLSESSVVKNAPYLLAIDADETLQSGRRNSVWVRVASRIDPNWLLELKSPLLQTDDRYYWADGVARVQVHSILRYGSIVLDESHAVAHAGPAATRVLVQIAEQRGVPQGECVSRLREKLRVLVEKGLAPVESLPDDSSVHATLELLCSARIDLCGVDDAALADARASNLGGGLGRALSRWAPDYYELPAGRRVRIQYESRCSPWIASRLQDFFGLESTPRIADGRQPLTLHLLAPNQRAVQVTQDLAGFWERHYPAIRRELMRRYPKHKWPEDPRTAAPLPNGPARTQRS